MKFKPACLVAVSMLALAAPTWAHHSRVMYEPTLYLTVTGTVKEFSWRNPHSWLYITAEGENGESIEWVLEANSAGQFARQGWAPDSLRPGDDITVTFRPMRDGSHAGLLGTATLADGSSISYRPQ